MVHASVHFHTFVILLETKFCEMIAMTGGNGVGARQESNHPAVEKVIRNVEKVIVGKRKPIELSLVALLAQGHVLLEDVPGVGKTLLVKTIAKSVSASFSRIQFTPDLLPSDLTGLSIYDEKEKQFVFKPGPLMGNIILADEINRTTPKTQSALLEGMEEGTVTVDGATHQLPQPFFVMATQNPIEYEGTFPLPEAQLDRFLLKIDIGYPSKEEELEVLNRFEKNEPFNEVEPVMSLSQLQEMQEEAKHVHVEESVKQYIVEIVSDTRRHPSILLGVSPRGTLQLMAAAKSYAYIRGRDFVIPDDIKALAPYVLSHRIALSQEAAFSGKQPGDLIQEIVEQVPVPIMKGSSL